jgi:hypothetical protein
MHPQNKSIRDLAIQAGLIAIAITALLLVSERVFPTSAPRPFGMPGWIAIIFMCGFEGCKEHTILPWILFAIVNFLVYAVVIFALLVVGWVITRRYAGKQTD